MNKTMIYAIAGALVIGAAGIVAFHHKPSGSSQSSPITSSTSMSMKEIFASGISQKCTFSTKESGIDSYGTVYVAESHMRGDFISHTPATGEVQSHLLTDGKVAYLWSNIVNQGIKMSFQGGPSANGIDPDRKIDYSCVPWSADQNLFELPTNVTFVSMSS